MKIGILHWNRAAFKPVRSNYDGELPVSIKYENLHSSSEEVIVLCKSMLETRI